MSRPTRALGLSQGDEYFRHKAAKTLFALQKDVVPPQEVGRSSLQQLQPTSAGPAAARSSDRRQVFVDGEMRLCEKG